MEDLETLCPRYPPLQSPVPAGKNPYEYFDGDKECLEDYMTHDQDDDYDPHYLSKSRADDEEEEEEDTDPTSSFFFQLKSVGPKLIPFLKTLGIYFVIFVPADRPSWFAVLLKCLPVASLGLFVILHGISLDQQHAFARKILLALFFSCIGDALLVWPSYFLEGMIFFSFAQISYIWAFGLEPPNFTLGVVIYASTSIGLGMIMPGLMLSEGGLIVGVPVYFILVTTMLWRACARVQIFEDLWTWSKVCSCFGSIFFIISDTVLGLNKFFVEVPDSQAIIMGTYYAAQLFMSLSVVNSHKAVIRVELESEVIDMGDQEFDGDSIPFEIDSFPFAQGSSRIRSSGRSVTWRNSVDSDDDELTLPKSRTQK